MPPEALSLGTCWEQHASTFLKTAISSAREISRGSCPGMAPNVSKHTPCRKKEAAAILLVVRTCSFQSLLRSNFQGLACPRGNVCLGPGLAGGGVCPCRAWHSSLPDRKAGLCCCWISATPEMLQEGRGKSQGVAGAAAGHGYFGCLTTGNSPE